MKQIKTNRLHKISLVIMTSLFVLGGLFLAHQKTEQRVAYAYTADDFVTTWNTGADKTISININPSFGSVTNYDYTIYWGDGQSTVVNDKLNHSHIYNAAGQYQVVIEGKIPAFLSGQADNAAKLLSVDQWGTNKWKSNSQMFANCTNLVFNATDSPDLSESTSLSFMFLNAVNFDSPLNFNTQNIKDMSGMFNNARSFNQPVNFNTENVTAMRSMFNNAQSFNQPVNFNTKNVTNMRSMFQNASAFNQPVNFDTQSAVSMRGMFQNTPVFNRPINFNTANVTDMGYMFNSAQAFNSSVNFNDMSQVTAIDGMFQNADRFNQPIDFSSATNIVNTRALFAHTDDFNSPIILSTANVTNMDGMFYRAHSFNQDISNFDFSNNPNLGNFVNDSRLDVNNYDKLLRKLHQQTNLQNVVFRPDRLKYCHAEVEHNSLRDDRSWDMNGDTKDCTNAHDYAVTEINLTKDNFDENLANAEVGQLSAVQNEVSTVNYSFCGGTDDNSFSLSNNELSFVGTADFETKSSYNICIRATDVDGGNFDKDFSIKVNDLNEAPVLTNQTITVDENLVNNTIITSFNATDPDNSQALIYTIISGNNSNIFAINNNQLVVNGELDYETVAQHNLIIEVRDNGTPALSDQANLTININNLDEVAPAITLNGEAELILGLNQPYVEAGASCQDDVDPACQIVISGTVEDNEGDYIITYSAIDITGNSAQKTRLIKRRDLTPPTFTGVSTLNFKTSDQIDLLVKIKAFDNKNNNISDKISYTIAPELDFDNPKAGRYLITYTVEDQNGVSVATVAKLIIVKGASNFDRILLPNTGLSDIDEFGIIISTFITLLLGLLFKNHRHSFKRN